MLVLRWEDAPEMVMLRQGMLPKYWEHEAEGCSRNDAKAGQ